MENPTVDETPMVIAGPGLDKKEKEKDVEEVVLADDDDDKEL